MDDRLHRALDEESSSHELTPRLRAELEEMRGLLTSVSRAIPDEPIPDLGAAVLRRIRAGEIAAPHQVRQRRRVASWLLAPRDLSLSIRPVYAIAAALVLAVAIGLAGKRGDGHHGATLAANSARPEQVLVSFRLEAPQAQNVALAGDFSNWTPAYAMRRSAPGVWTIVVPLSPGVHEYSFVVDGKRWVPDPMAVAKPDGFGGVNSRIAVLKPDKRA